MKHQKFISSCSGSILMEFVLVLPIYIATIGAIFAIGFRALDTINLRATDHWLVWGGGYRGMRPNAVTTPVLLGKLFPRKSFIYGNVKRALNKEKAYIQVIGSKTTVGIKNPDFINFFSKAPETVYEAKKFKNIPIVPIYSTLGNNKFSQYILMRTKHSKDDPRHWHSSLLYAKSVWNFEDEYPEKWTELLTKDKTDYDDDDKKFDEPNPKKYEFYTRYKEYEKWSKNP